MGAHIFQGETGSGKSYNGLDAIIENCLEGERLHCVTNLAINIAELREYVQERGGSADKITVLKDEETRTFWRFRGDAMMLVEQVMDKDGYLRYQVTAPVTHGVLYVIDEAHNYFRARDVALTSKECLWYLSQNRQFGDKVVIITQHLKNMDVAFSRLAETVTICRNISRMRIGIFRLWNGFSRVEYSDIPGPGVENHLTFRRFDKKRAACYNTAAAARAPGAKADTQDKKRGVTWVVPAIGLCLFFVFLFSWPRLTRAFADARMESMKKKFGTAQVQRAAASVNPQGVMEALKSMAERRSILDERAVEKEKEETRAYKPVSSDALVSWVWGEEFVFCRTYSGKVYKMKGATCGRNGLRWYDGRRWELWQEPQGFGLSVEMEQ